MRKFKSNFDEIFLHEISKYGRPHICTFAHLEFLHGFNYDLGISETNLIAVVWRTKAKHFDPLSWCVHIQIQDETIAFTKTSTNFVAFWRQLTGKTEQEFGKT